MFGNSLQKQTTKPKIYSEKGKKKKKNLIKMNGRKGKNRTNKTVGRNDENYNI